MGQNWRPREKGSGVSAPQRGKLTERGRPSKSSNGPNSSEKQRRVERIAPTTKVAGQRCGPSSKSEAQAKEGGAPEEREEAKMQKRITDTMGRPAKHRAKKIR